MTLIAGFVCSDGFVIAADTEVTGEFRTQSSKLLGAGGSGSYQLVLGAAGNDVLCDELMQGVHDDVVKQVPSIEDAEEIIRERVRSIHNAVVFPQWSSESDPNLRLRVSLLVGLRDTSDRCCLWRSESNSIARVTNTAFIGTGAGVAAYVAERLFMEALPAAITHHIATQIVREAKIRGAFVGGNTDTWSVLLKNPTRPYFDIPESNVDYLWSLEDKLATAVRCALWGDNDRVAKCLIFLGEQLETIRAGTAQPLAGQGDSWHTIEIGRPDLHPFRDFLIKQRR